MKLLFLVAIFSGSLGICYFIFKKSKLLKQQELGGEFEISAVLDNVYFKSKISRFNDILWAFDWIIRIVICAMMFLSGEPVVFALILLGYVAVTDVLISAIKMKKMIWDLRWFKFVFLMLFYCALWGSMLLLLAELLFIEPLILESPTGLALWVAGNIWVEYLLGVVFLVGILPVMIWHLLWLLLSAYTRVFAGYKIGKVQDGLELKKKVSGKTIWQINCKKPYRYYLAKRVTRDMNAPSYNKTAYQIFEQDGKALAIGMDVNKRSLFKVPRLRVLADEKDIETIYAVSPVDSELLKMWVKEHIKKSG